MPAPARTQSCTCCEALQSETWRNNTWTPQPFMKHKSLTTVPREGRAPSAANHHRDTGRPHHGTAGAAHGLPAPFNLQGRAQDHDDTHKPAGPAGPAEAGRVGLAPARPRPGPSQAQAPRAQSGASAKSTAVVWDGCVCVCVRVRPADACGYAGADFWTRATAHALPSARCSPGPQQATAHRRAPAPHA